MVITTQLKKMFTKFEFLTIDIFNMPEHVVVVM